MGDTSKVEAVAVGVVTLHFEVGKQLVLYDCLYVTIVRRNMILVSSLSCNRYSAIFNKDSVFIKNGSDNICCGMLRDNLYIIEPLTPKTINSIESNHKRKEPSSVDQAQL